MMAVRGLGSLTSPIVISDDEDAASVERHLGEFDSPDIGHSPQASSSAWTDATLVVNNNNNNNNNSNSNTNGVVVASVTGQKRKRADTHVPQVASLPGPPQESKQQRKKRRKREREAALAAMQAGDPTTVLATSSLPPPPRLLPLLSASPLLPANPIPHFFLPNRPQPLDTHPVHPNMQPLAEIHSTRTLSVAPPLEILPLLSLGGPSSSIVPQSQMMRHSPTLPPKPVTSFTAPSAPTGYSQPLSACINKSSSRVPSHSKPVIEIPPDPIDSPPLDPAGRMLPPHLEPHVGTVKKIGMDDTDHQFCRYLKSQRPVDVKRPDCTLVLAPIPKKYRNTAFVRKWASRFASQGDFRIVDLHVRGRALVEFATAGQRLAAFNSPRLPPRHGQEYIRAWRYLPEMDLEEGEIAEPDPPESESNESFHTFNSLPAVYHLPSFSPPLALRLPPAPGSLSLPTLPPPPLPEPLPPPPPVPPPMFQAPLVEKKKKKKKRKQRVPAPSREQQDFKEEDALWAAVFNKQPPGLNTSIPQALPHRDKFLVPELGSGRNHKPIRPTRSQGVYDGEQAMDLGSDDEDMVEIVEQPPFEPEADMDLETSSIASSRPASPALVAAAIESEGLIKTYSAPALEGAEHTHSLSFASLTPESGEQALQAKTMESILKVNTSVEKAPLSIQHPTSAGTTSVDTSDVHTLLTASPEPQSSITTSSRSSEDQPTQPLQTAPIDAVQQKSMLQQRQEELARRIAWAKEALAKKVANSTGTRPQTPVASASQGSSSVDLLSIDSVADATKQSDHPKVVEAIKASSSSSLDSTDPTPPHTPQVETASAVVDENMVVHASTTIVAPVASMTAEANFDDLAVSFIAETLQTVKQPSPPPVPLRPTPSMEKMLLAAKQKRLEQHIAESKALMEQLGTARSKAEKDTIFGRLRELRRAMDEDVKAGTPKASPTPPPTSFVNHHHAQPVRAWKARWPETLREATIIFISDDEDEDE